MCDNQFWTRDISQLWCDWTLIPSQDEGLYVQLNTMTRLAIVLAVTVFIVRSRVEEGLLVLSVGVGGMALLAILLELPVAIDLHIIVLVEGGPSDAQVPERIYNRVLKCPCGACCSCAGQLDLRVVNLVA